MLPIDPENSRLSAITGQINQAGNNQKKDDTKFVDAMSEFIGDVNSLQKESMEKTDAFIKGEPVDIHDVMITAEKAKTSFELLMELRNKALDLYSEVNRMQV